METVYWKIAFWLPQRVVYFAFIRFWSAATTHKEGTKMTPDQMTWTKAIELWEDRYKNKR